MTARMGLGHWAAVALACALGACSFEDRVKHCNGPGECQEGEECYQGFCIRAVSGERSSASKSGDDVQDDDDSKAGASGNSKSGSGGAGRRGGSGGNGTSNAASGSGAESRGGDGASDEPPSGSSGTGGGGDGAAASGGTEAPSGGSPAGRSGGAGAGMPPTSGSGGKAPEPTPGCTPTGAESCNGEDDDCDGTTDEQSDVVCYPDNTKGCSESNGKWTCQGLCDTGTRTCTNGKLGDCTDAKVPGTETCTPANAKAADENCDGKVDETCACMAGETKTCYGGPAGTLDVGICKGGTQACDNGMLSPCMGEVLPGTETCANAGADDDCNGKVDDIPNVGGGCMIASNQGICKNGTLACETGKADPVCVAVAPGTETCNSLDDDCNGKVDDPFDLQTDAKNCGACGTTCKAGEMCAGGKCGTMMTDPMMPMMPATCSPACASGQNCCGTSCVDFANDVKNCGACGNACTGAQPGCCNGRCVDLVSNGNCGACGRDCSLLTNGGVTCSCMKGSDGKVGCIGPLLNLCL